MGSSSRAALLDFARYGERTVLADASIAHTAGTLARAVAEAAAGLHARGIAPGDRVAVLGPTTTATAVAILGALAHGAVVVPLNPRHREAELAHVVGDSGTVLAIVDPTLDDRLARAVPELARVGLAGLAGSQAEPAWPDDDAPALVIYTSGTTGPSKGAELSIRAVVEHARALGGLWGIDDTDVLVLALPLFHVHGLCVGLVNALVHRATVRLHARFEPPAIVREFADYGATLFMGVPTMYVGLLEQVERDPAAAVALARARLFTAGSAALAASVHGRFATHTNHAILERYGMTETLITLSNPLVGERRPGSVGRPLPGATIRLVDDDHHDVAPGEAGELLVRAPWLMNGYHRRPEDTARSYRNGWFRTGDVATVDADGYVRIVGRTSTDIVKTGGFKVATREIEDVLAEHPAIAEAAVIGVPDERWGERIVAVVVARGHADSAALTEAVLAHVRARLADYKTPREVHIVAELPKNAMGKLEKTRLRELMAGGDATRSATPARPRR